MTLSPHPEKLLVLELWGLGDLALAMPFLQTAAQHTEVTLVAKPHAAPLLRRFAPSVDHLALSAPWTAFAGKYRFHRWPWRELTETVRHLRRSAFATAVSARPDPRDHFLMRLSGAARRIGFSRGRLDAGLSLTLPTPTDPHRAQHWAALAATFGWTLPAPTPGPTRVPRRILIHTGAGHRVRQWPAGHFAGLAGRLRSRGWEVDVVDETLGDLDALIGRLADADAFIGNDSGPGHIAALLGLPTYTIFGPQLPALFHPVHPRAAWSEGAPCDFKPCFDSCRYPTPHCLLGVDPDEVGKRVETWLSGG